jgi:methionyl-tRNA synthetase
MQLARWGNKYLTETEPWKLQKTDPQRTAFILFQCTQIVAKLSIALEPFLPFTVKKIKKGLNLNTTHWSLAFQNVIVPSGHQIDQVPILFEKITDEQVQLQVAKLQQSKTLNASSVMEQKSNITFEQFQQMDLRMVKVLAAEKVAKTKKLLKLTIDTGLDERTVVSGIAEHYSPEEMVGKNVLMLINLAPREIKGIESQGMILMAENAEGKLCALSSDQNIQPGNIVA